MNTYTLILCVAGAWTLVSALFRLIDRIEGRS